MFWFLNNVLVWAKKEGVMKRGQGTCTTFKVNNLTYLFCCENNSITKIILRKQMYCNLSLVTSIFVASNASNMVLARTKQTEQTLFWYMHIPLSRPRYVHIP